MEALLILVVILAILGLITLGRSVRQVQQYEEGIVFRFGRVLPRTRPPGLTFIRPIGDRIQKVNKQIIAMAVPAQEGITMDNVSVRVDAVVYFRVVDPIKATINVQNYMFAVSQQAQTSLRSIIGQTELQQLLAERDSVNRQLRAIIDEPTEGPWGVKVERVEIKDVSLPEGMKRSMARQAEAERERRARIITADGEYQASKRLAAAANVMARDPAALQLRLLQTVVEVAAEKNSTLVMPVPVELLRFFDRGSGQLSQYAGELPEDTGDAEVAAAEAAIEHKPLPPEAAAIGQDEALAIPPVAPIPQSPVAEGAIPDPLIPEPDVPEPAIPEARVPDTRSTGGDGADPSKNGSGDQAETSGN
ncbi:MAG TPA: SPFH domain-containing protein [Streptosporangiaceae bacterium]|nr:SPFH domain-containing protein [Streptosporangiaceae bacterium]